MRTFCSRRKLSIWRWEEKLISRETARQFRIDLGTRAWISREPLTSQPDRCSHSNFPVYASRMFIQFTVNSSSFFSSPFASFSSSSPFASPFASALPIVRSLFSEEGIMT